MAAIETKTPDTSPQILQTPVDEDFADLDVGETYERWRSTVRKALGVDGVELSFTDLNKPLFALRVSVGPDGKETARYVRADLRDFGTNVREPEAHGLPPPVERLASIRDAQDQRLKEQELFRKVQPLRDLFGQVNTLARQNQNDIDGILIQDMSAQLRDRGDVADVVADTTVLVRLGAISEGPQRTQLDAIVKQLQLPAETRNVLVQMVQNANASRPNGFALDATLRGIYNYQPPQREGASAEDFDSQRALLLAYATGVAIRMQRPGHESLARSLEDTVTRVLASK